VNEVFPSKRITFQFCSQSSYPLRNRKLAREGNAFARKRNATIFLIAFMNFVRGPAPMLRSTINQVPLDGAETKSEDYQRDVSRRAALGPMTALN
jgi:hypothetical protein